MGSGQSARKLTISNEEEIDVIKISNSVIERLTHNATNIEPQKVANNDVRATALPREPPPMEPPSVGAPSGYYYPQYTISALQMQQEKEKELSLKDHYWEDRLDKLKKSHERIDLILEDEYKKAYNLYGKGELTFL